MNEMGSLTKRVAIVTGAAQGLGLAVAARLLAEGAFVTLADVQAGKVAEAAERLDPSGSASLAVGFDASSSAEADRMVAATGARFGGVDILVNVAGGSGTARVERIDDMTDAIWDRIITNNLRATFACSRAAVAAMRQRGGGAIVNFATGSIRGFPARTTSSAPLAYVAAKAGIIGFTNQLAKDLLEASIAASVLQPGFVLTEPGARVREIFDSLPEPDRQAMLARRVPRTPEEIGWAVAFILSRAVADVSGLTIRLDGPIDSLDLALKREMPGALAATAILSKRPRS
ncbi:MAG TPA: SDR family NAD(P)-dependent oxidoreductase [Beijerinckiaceae bacterium]|nr:SDR family NAD(P)-dependent oxidoreductase [Beijerinckiaceae bacterium]